MWSPRSFWKLPMQVLATLIVNKIRGIVDCCFLVNKGMTGSEVMIYFLDVVLKSRNLFLTSGHVFCWLPFLWSLYLCWINILTLQTWMFSWTILLEPSFIQPIPTWHTAFEVDVTDSGAVQAPGFGDNRKAILQAINRVSKRVTPFWIWILSPTYPMKTARKKNYVNVLYLYHLYFFFQTSEMWLNQLCQGF